MHVPNSADGNNAHVDVLISGYLDGELTQQQRQRVEVHIDGCPQCREQLQQLARVRKRVAGARLSPVGEDVWRENMGDVTVRASRGVGWLLFLGGLLLLAGYGIWQFVIDTSVETLVKFMVAAVYLGLGALFVAVLRQRLIERKTDKYKDVEI